MDSAFDAGGKVSVGLTATTIVSQWTWAATLLQSSGVASKVNNKSSYRKLFSKFRYIVIKNSIIFKRVTQKIKTERYAKCEIGKKSEKCKT